MASNKIRILIVDDHPVVRDGLVAILTTQADFWVVAEAGDGRQALEQLKACHPDVVLLDLEMPGIDGVETLRQMRLLAPQLRVIVFTAFDSDERIVTAVRAGAQGYLLKGAPRQALFAAIRLVHSGDSLLQPLVASDRLLPTAPETAVLAEPLTSRELEVLQEMALGLQNKEIAARLVISERTVKFHVSAILSKLGAGNRTEAVTLAVQQGLVEIGTR